VSDGIEELTNPIIEEPMPEAGSEQLVRTGGKVVQQQEVLDDSEDMKRQ